MIIHHSFVCKFLSWKFWHFTPQWKCGANYFCILKIHIALKYINILSKIWGNITLWGIYLDFRSQPDENNVQKFYEFRLCVPLIIWSSEKIYLLLGKMGKIDTGSSEIQAGIILPSKTTSLIIKKPDNFKHRIGDWVYIQIPAVARFVSILLIFESDIDQNFIDSESVV